MNREIKDWADWAVSQGWTVGDDAKGYTHFYTPDGDPRRPLPGDT